MMSPNRPTIRDVAARAGVSKSLVSRVLHESPLVSAERRAAVLQAIEELGYHPNAAARTLVRRRSYAVAILVTDLHNLFVPEVVQGLDGILEAAGYTTLLVSGKHRRQAEEAALRRILELRVDGIVCVTAELGAAALAAAAQSTAVVNLTREPRVPRVDTVVNDDRLGERLVVDHLAQLGHRRIAMIADTEERAGADRIDGYREAMARHGLGAHVEVVPGGFTESGGHRAARALVDRSPDDRPTAIAVASDLAALGVLDAAAEAGLDVPGRLSIVGYDNTPFARLRHIALTTVDQDTTAIGAMAGDALLRRIDEPDHRARRIVVAPSLIARATSGPAPR